jgi:hypothetical protein
MNRKTIPNHSYRYNCCGRDHDIVLRSESQSFCEELFLLRNVREQNPGTLPHASTLDGRLLRALGRSVCLSPNTDNRASALMLLTALDKQHTRRAKLD